MSERETKQQDNKSTVVRRVMSELNRLDTERFHGNLVVNVTFTWGGISTASIVTEEKNIICHRDPRTKKA